MHRIFISKQNNYEKQVRVLLKKNCIHDVLVGFSLLIQKFQTWNFNAKKNFLITLSLEVKTVQKHYKIFPISYYIYSSNKYIPWNFPNY